MYVICFTIPRRDEEWKSTLEREREREREREIEREK
jgi:hypothetical protein